MNAKLLGLCVIVLAPVLLLTGCGVNPEKVTTEYLTALRAGEFDKAVARSTVDLDRDMQSGKNDERTQLARAYMQRISFEVRGAQKDGEMYKVRVDIKGPDMPAIMAKVTSAMVSSVLTGGFSAANTVTDNSDLSRRWVEAVVTAMEKPDAPTVTTEGTLSLKKVDNQWKVTTPIMGDGGLLTSGRLSLADQTRQAAALQERMTKTQADIKDLERQREFAAQASEQLRQFQILHADFYWRKDTFLDDPVISLTVQNHTGYPISRAYFHGRLMSIGRSIPWVEDDFNYMIRGGIEPGETQTWNLGPNSFGPWGSAPKDRNDLALEVVVKKLDGANGETLFDAEFPAYKAERLVELEKLLQSLEAEVAKLSAPD